MRAEEVKGLMEAYSKVYESPEILEEEIVEKDVEQIDEIAVNFGGQAAVDKVRAQMAAQKQSDAKLAAYRAQRFGGVNPVVKAAKGGVQGTLDKTTGKFTASKPAAPTAAAKPAAAPTATVTKPTVSAPAARPTPTPVSTSSAPKPTTTVSPSKPVGSPMDQWKSANPTLAAKVSSSGTQMGTGQSAMSKQASELRAMQSASRQRQGLTQGVDIFDLVKGHLLDEGYAETEEAAIIMMANMSEEWRNSILESCGVDLEETKKWIQKAIKHPGALHKKLGVPEGEKIPAKKLAAAAKQPGATGKQARLAQTLKGFHESKGDGNLANNYPPYDKVTRGDVIAGALGKDQMGGKKKKSKKEED